MPRSCQYAHIRARNTGFAPPGGAFVVPAGLLLSLAAVTVCTVLIFPLREIAPAVSTGVVYLLGVLVVSIYSSRWVGLLTSVLSATAFNFFHIPPTGHIEIADGENWVALGVFLISAVIAGSIADQARARADEAEVRRREADLSAAMAGALLGGGSVTDSLEATARRIAEAFDLAWAKIELGDSDAEDARAIPLHKQGSAVAVLLVPNETPEEGLERLRSRVVPSLDSPRCRDRPRRAGRGGDRGERPAPKRRDQDGAAALRFPRPAFTDHRRDGRRGGPRIDRDLRYGPSRPRRRGLRRGEQALGPRRQAARPFRLEAGQAEPRTDWCSIEEIVTAAVSDLGDQAGLIRVSLERDLPYVGADAAQLERAIANLLENAVRFSAGQTSMVRGRAVGGRLVLRVVDRGPGIPESDLDQVFEPFYRVEGGGAHPGSGLGLSIVRGFVEVNGGRVWAESVAGQGTIFVIELPLEPGPTEPDRPLRTGARP